MKTPLACRRLCLLLAPLLLAPPAGVRAGGFLHTEGTTLRDTDGRTVLLRGVGLGNWLLPEGYMWRFGNQADRPRRIEALVQDLIGPEAASRFWTTFRRDYVSEADIRRVAELGFNCVRPALNARLFLTETDPPRYVDEGFALLDDLVRWCRDHGVYVILDMHAAPGGQTGRNIDDSARDEPELFSRPENQDRLVDLWVKLATRYRDEPTVAAYDLLNEPLPRRTGAAARYGAQLEPLYRRITAAIRRVDRRHMITLEGMDWANDWSVFTERFDDNTLYQFHYYCWDRPDTLKSVGTYLAERARLGAPIWVGETGEKGNAIYWGTTQYFEAHDIGWSFWPWKKMDTDNTPYSIVPPRDWEAVRAYSRGGPAPARRTAQRAFDELLENIRLERCVFRHDVVNAILRRVPGRVEAENYGHDGPGRSYGVHDASRRSPHYRRDEPVAVEVMGDPQSFRSQQCIRLETGEWTAYRAELRTPRTLHLAVRVRTTTAGAGLRVALGDQTWHVRPEPGDWQTVPLGTIAREAGPLTWRASATRGTVWVDAWDVESAAAP